MNRNTAAAAAIDMTPIETVLRLHNHFPYTSKEAFSVLWLAEVADSRAHTILQNMG